MTFRNLFIGNAGVIRTCGGIGIPVHARLLLKMSHVHHCISGGRPDADRAMALERQDSRVAEGLSDAGAVLFRQNQFAVWIHRHGLLDKLHAFATHRHERDTQNAHNNGKARVHVDNRLHIRTRLVYAGVNLDLKALGDARWAANLEALQIADNHSIRLHAGERINGVTAALDDERVQAVRHPHAHVAERAEYAGGKAGLR